MGVVRGGVLLAHPAAVMIGSVAAIAIVAIDPHGRIGRGNGARDGIGLVFIGVRRDQRRGLCSAKDRANIEKASSDR